METSLTEWQKDDPTDLNAGTLGENEEIELAAFQHDKILKCKAGAEFVKKTMSFRAVSKTNLQTSKNQSPPAPAEFEDKRFQSFVQALNHMYVLHSSSKWIKIIELIFILFYFIKTATVTVSVLTCLLWKHWIQICFPTHILLHFAKLG